MLGLRKRSERAATVSEVLDAVVVGGGPAGLSAGLILGRCRRRVVIFDSGEYRNAVSIRASGFLSGDGSDPAELRRISRDQLVTYPSVELRMDVVTSAVPCDGGGCEGSTARGNTVRCRVLLLATGVVDDVPTIAGAQELYGRGVFHCPYCDGFEVADRPLAAYGIGRSAVDLALELRLWSTDVILCTDGPSGLSLAERTHLQANGVELFEERVAGVHGDRHLDRILFDDGSQHECHALFFVSAQRQRSKLAEMLGCEFADDGSVSTGEYETTTVPGLYVAGDASRLARLAIIAAAEGAQAAATMNTALLHADLH